MNSIILYAPTAPRAKVPQPLAGDAACAPGA